MEAVVTLLTCAFVTFCGPDGTCRTDTPMQVIIDLGAEDDSIQLWTTPSPTGPATPASIQDPRPTRRGEPLHLLARTRDEGALLISPRADPDDDTTVTATLRRHPDMQGNPTGPDATLSEANCAQSFFQSR